MNNLRRLFLWKGMKGRNFPFKINFFIWALIVLLLGSCASRRHLIKEPIKEYGPDYLLDQMGKNEFRFDWFSAKLSIDYQYAKKKTGFKGQIRIRKDSAIWVSFSPALGIEAARLLITNDSVKFIDRMNKEYLLGDWDFINQFLETNIDFDILQSFIIGNDFQFYEKTKFRAAYDSREYRLSTAGRNKLKKYVEENEELKVFIQTIWLNPDNFKITRVMIKEIKKENKKLNAFYFDFEEFENQLFPTDMKFVLTGQENIYIDVKFSRISVNKPRNLPFTISKKFKRVY